MSNKKQSSIDLFAIALYEKGFIKGNGNEINDLLEEHKAMHKEEMQEAVLHVAVTNNDLREILTRQFDKYYHETFDSASE